VLRKAKEAELHKAATQGYPQALIDWYNAGADGQINWGEPGDWKQCVDIAGQYIEHPEGFCQLRHMDATGEPTGHAPDELGAGLLKKADEPDYTKIISDRKGEPDDQDLYNRVKADAKKKFDVYPSAVANGWVVQEYKRRGGKYKKPVAKAESFTPPKGVQEAAQQALEWMKDGKAGDGFTPVGRKRASDSAHGHAVSLDTLKRMKAYFDRHQSDKDSPHWNEPSPGKVAWYAWGGDAGYSWAQSVVGRQVEKGDYAGHVFRGNQHSHGGVIAFDPTALHFTTICSSGHQNTVLVPSQWVERTPDGKPTGQIAVGAQTASCTTCYRPLANRWIMVDGRKRADNPDTPPTRGYYGLPPANYVDVPKPKT